MSRSLRTRLDRLETQNNANGLVVEWAKNEAEAERLEADWQANGDPRKLFIVHWEWEDAAGTGQND